jgi:hypothetical protein
VRDARLRHEERAARVDVLHEVVALHRQLLGAGDGDRARVVDDDVDAAEPLDRLRDGARHRLLVADVAHDRQGLAARRLDRLGSGVDRALELGVRLGGLGDQRDVRAIAGGALRDREADAAARAGDEHGLAFE